MSDHHSESDLIKKVATGQISPNQARAKLDPPAPRFKVGDVVEDNHGPVGTIELVHPGENFPYRIREADGKLGSYSDYKTLRLATPVHDPVNHPKHYTDHPSGIECIQITEHMGFNLGNAIKYVWRADLKGSSIQDLKKAGWYIEREIQKREAAK